MFFIKLTKFISTPETFYHEYMLDFVKCFFCVYSYDHVIFLLQPVDVVDNIDFLKFYLAMLVLNCSTQDLCWVMWDLSWWLSCCSHLQLAGSAAPQYVGS